MNRLRELRNNQRLTVRELADKVNISYPTISRLETGTVNFNEQYLTILADFFGVSSDYLLGRSDIKNTQIIDQKNTDRFETLDNILQREMEGIDYAFFGEVKDLTDAQKEDLITMARILKKQNKEG